MTSVVVLPVHDMRILAGEVVVADILTEGRLMLGVGRGAFAFEMDRLGVPLEESRARFDESLDVLIALLSREEVSWDGEHYRFPPLTVMPRPGSAGRTADHHGGDESGRHLPLRAARVSRSGQRRLPASIRCSWNRCRPSRGHGARWARTGRD